MEPIYGLILILIIAGLSALIASKRGRSGWKFFAISLAPIPLILPVMAKLSEGNGVVMGLSAFLPAVVTFFAAILVKSGPEVAATEGSYKSFVRCPYCAEPIRNQAIRCRHCGSDLPESEEDAEQPAPLPAFREINDDASA